MRRQVMDINEIPLREMMYIDWMGEQETVQEDMERECRA